jgi:hypothetical protein
MTRGSFHGEVAPSLPGNDHGHNRRPRQLSYFLGNAPLCRLPEILRCGQVKQWTPRALSLSLWHD